jgi:predicted ATP-grasp superfamily ATP-dependent carboligase
MKKVIILGNDHTNTLGLTQVLGREGFYVIACVWGDKRGLVKASRYCKELYGGANSNVCVDILASFPQETEGEKIPIIASCDDAALVLEQNRENLKERFLFEHTQGSYSIEQLLEKELQVKLAINAGFNVPQSWMLEEYEAQINTIKYPILIKPLASLRGAKADIRICRNREDVNKNLSSLQHTQKVIVQQYIDHDYEISILGCGLSSGDVKIPCVENKLTLYPKYVGLECLANMQPLTDECIIRPIKKLITAIEYVGLFSVEMMHNREDGKFYFTEINLRNDGANSFVYKYGVNLPLMHICDLHGQAISETSETAPGYYIWDMHHFMSLLHRDISFQTWLKEIKLSHGFLTYFPEDKKPFFKQYSNWFLNKLHLKGNKKY